MTNLEYFNLCEHHDWYFEYSDDHKAWERGWSANNRLENLAKESEVKGKIFEAHRAYRFTGKTWGTEQVPKPTLQDFNL